VKRDVRVLTTSGVLTALSLMLELSFAIPIIATAPFLLYSPGDLPIIFITYLFGIIPGIIAVAINASLFVLIRGEGGPYGLIMHFVAASAFVSVFCIFRRSTKMVHLITGLALGTVARALIMIPANLILTPIYLKVPQEVVKGMIVPAIIPFNLLHSGINSVLFILLYIPLRSLLDKKRN
jgi:riboflavin transporter FmnP